MKQSEASSRKHILSLASVSQVPGLGLVLQRPYSYGKFKM